MKDGTITVTGCDRVRGMYDITYNGTVTEGYTKDKDEYRNLKIIRLLYGVGIQVTSIGFYYFYAAIQICMEDRLASTNAQKNIYMVIAEHYNVSYKSVERAIRVAFPESVSMRASRLFENEMKIFTFQKNDEITPLEFISLAALVVSA